MKEQVAICKLCNQEIIRFQKINDGFIGALCESCDHLSTIDKIDQVSPVESTSKLYSLEDRILTYYLRKKEFLVRYENLLKLISQIISRKIESILDVGGNIGYFAMIAKNKGISVETLEVLEDLRIFQRLAYGINSYENPEEIPKGNRYDVIVLMDVLEHIEHPIDFLKELKSYLKKDGGIFVQSPNKNSLSARIAGEHWNWWQSPDHLHHFSQRSLELVARLAGFHTSWSRTESPLLDDIVNLPVAGKLFGPLRVLSRWINVNPTVSFRYGSLLQVFLFPYR